MLTKYLNTLEYPKILNQLARHAAFSASRELAQQLTPTPYFAEALALQAETTEACHLLAVKPDVTAAGATDVRNLVEQARRAMIIPPPGLLTIARTLITARDLHRKIVPLADRYPHLSDIACRLEEIPGIISEINRCIDPAGTITDAASPALAAIRREINLVHGRLQDKLRHLLTAEKSSQYLQEGFITQRDGRYVVPLKAEFKGRIRGIIHDQSTSGATLFVEPMIVVDLNNQWKQLQLDETQEINRILSVLTLAVAEQGKYIAATVQALAELDLIFARARYAVELNATAPILLNPDSPPLDTPRLHLRAARHPLLNPETVVPIDLALPADTTMLIITGPNTGGKTVSLKTAGLLTLMAQSGLQIPTRDGSSLMVFDQVFADIGDEQSLEQSLSTFSGHMTNIVNILSHCTQRSLVIFDELGAGTDPIEGAALARAILDRLLAANTTTLVATHYAELKAFAYTIPGVTNASMTFDLASLSPTFKLQVGLPGNSNAFAIAERLGLDKTILQSAQGLVGKDAKEIELMLTQIKADQDAARLERLRISEERAEAEFYRQKLEVRLANAEQERENILRRARQQAQRELDKIRAELRTLRKEAKLALSKLPPPAALPPEAVESPETIKTVETALTQAETRLDTLQTTVTAKTPPQPQPPVPKSKPLKIGDKVEIPHLNSQGIITAMTATDIEVQLGHFRTTLKRQKVNLLESATTETAPIPLTGNSGMASSPGLELDLRGEMAEDALHRLDGYLDQAYLAGLPYVRLVHGKGSGILRQVIRDALRDHPLISSYRAGQDNEGGEGVTVAKLAVD